MESPAGRYQVARGQVADQRGESRGDQEKPPFQVFGTVERRLEEIVVALAHEPDFPAGNLLEEERLWMR